MKNKTNKRTNALSVLETLTIDGFDGDVTSDKKAICLYIPFLFMCVCTMRFIGGGGGAGAREMNGNGHICTQCVPQIPDHKFGSLWSKFHTCVTIPTHYHHSPQWFLFAQLLISRERTKLLSFLFVLIFMIS